MIATNVIYENKSRPFSCDKGSGLSPVPHLHKEIELIYVKEGRCIAHADHSHYLLQSGDLFFAFPNQIHYYEKSVSGIYYVTICLPDILLGLEKKLKNYVPDSNLLHLGNFSPEEYLILQAYGAGRESRISAACGYMNQLIGRIFPSFTLNPLIASDNITVRSIIDYCSRNSSDKITLDTAAQALHLSKYYISHLMNQKLHLCFNDYINSLRIEAACDMLRNTDKKIADISEDAGFGTIRSFNRSFLNIMQMTPKDYREMQKPGQPIEFR